MQSSTQGRCDHFSFRLTGLTRILGKRMRERLPSQSPTTVTRKPQPLTVCFAHTAPASPTTSLSYHFHYAKEACKVPPREPPSLSSALPSTVGSAFTPGLDLSLSQCDEAQPQVAYARESTETCAVIAGWSRWATGYTVRRPSYIFAVRPASHLVTSARQIHRTHSSHPDPSIAKLQESNSRDRRRWISWVTSVRTPA